MPSPVALVNAAVTNTVHNTRYTPKYHLTQRGKILRPSFERRLSCRELPARDAFIQNILEERADGDRPEQNHAIARAADGGRHDVARADSGGGDDEARACELEKTE